MATRAAFRIDRTSTALAVERNARDGVVQLRVPLTWIGVRTYVDAATGERTRELRRPEQVWSKSHIASLRLLTATHAHPVGDGRYRGLPVMLDARADSEAGPGPDGQLRRPPAMYQVGQTGDEIERVKIDGHDLPVARVAIHGAAAVRDIEERGWTQTSLGYGCYIDRTPGVWKDPATGLEHPYDAEHVLDAEDPRVVAAVADGFDPDTLGANHLAVGIPRGRGGAMSELLPRRDAWDAARSGPARVIADAVVWNPNPGLYESPTGELAAADARLLRAMLTAEIGQAEDGPVPLEAIVAPLAGTYEWGSKWRGWLEVLGGIGFVDHDGRGLWWAKREEDGGVVGSPTSFAWTGPPLASPRGDDGALPAREDLGEPRSFAMLRAADESATSGTGRVMDGVLWPDGSVATRWRSEQPGAEFFETWTRFHAVHACAHPGNGTTFEFADGGEPPPCAACSGSAAGRSDAAPYPPAVDPIRLPLTARAVADKVAAKLPGSKLAAKADALELTLAPDVAGPVAEVLQALTDYCRSMAGDLAQADKAAGEAAAALAAAQADAAKQKALADAAKPFLDAAAKDKRDALVVEAEVVAGRKLDAELAEISARKGSDGAKLDAEAEAAAIRGAAVKARLGDAMRRDSADAIEGAWVSLLAAFAPRRDTAGGKDPADKSKPAEPAKQEPAKQEPKIPPVKRDELETPSGGPALRADASRADSILYATDDASA